MPTFCRHNRPIQNCPICSREQDIEARPLVSGATSGRARTTPRHKTTKPPRSKPGIRVSRLARGDDDGYRSALAPGLRSSADADRLADEIAFAAHRLHRLKREPPGLYAKLARPESDLEERTWLCFLIAYLGPLDDGDPFREIERTATSWRSGELPNLDGVTAGPRSAHDPARGAGTVQAYRGWADRAGSQAAAFTGDAGWSPERRFARVFERLALPGFHRDAKYELLVSLGRLGLFELRAGSLALGGENEVTVAAKRALGIGDPLLLERRAAELAAACEVPLEALDLGFFNWERGERARGGLDLDSGDAEELSSIRSALGL